MMTAFFMGAGTHVTGRRLKIRLSLLAISFAAQQTLSFNSKATSSKRLCFPGFMSEIIANISVAKIS